MKVEFKLTRAEVRADRARDLYYSEQAAAGIDHEVICLDGKLLYTIDVMIRTVVVLSYKKAWYMKDIKSGLRYFTKPFASKEVAASYARRMESPAEVVEGYALDWEKLEEIGAE